MARGDSRRTSTSAGDEPLMLARALPGVPVLVGADRICAGRLAEEQLGATVHLLDDGFQHVQLARDVDLLVDQRGGSAATGRCRPGGCASRCRPRRTPMPRWSTRGYDAEAERESGERWALQTVFSVARTLGAASTGRAVGETVVVPTDEPVFAVAGIARPERFFADLASAGWRVAGTMAFRDHHMFTDRDVARVAAAARAAGADDRHDDREGCRAA